MAVSAAVSAAAIVSRVSHLADQDHVGRLAQRRAQPAGEASTLSAELALVDQAALRRVSGTRSGLRESRYARVAVRFRCSVSAISVVDFPEPAAPVTSTRPFGYATSS
jgi:hypothetical protein